MIHIGSDKDIGMNRNISDCLGMNSYPILSPGKLLWNSQILKLMRNLILENFSQKLISISEKHSKIMLITFR